MSRKNCPKTPQICGLLTPIEPHGVLERGTRNKKVFENFVFQTVHFLAFYIFENQQNAVVKIQ